MSESTKITIVTITYNSEKTIERTIQSTARSLLIKAVSLVILFLVVKTEQDYVLYALLSRELLKVSA